MIRINKAAKLVLDLIMKIVEGQEEYASYKSKTPSKEKGPQILKNISNRVFKRTTVDFDEELLLIKQQLLDEDNNQEGENSCPVSNKI